MGLLKIESNNISEYIYASMMPNNVLMRKGINNVNQSNMVLNGSKILVKENQFLILVLDGKIIDFTSEIGMYTYDSQTEPCMIYSKFDESVLEVFKKYLENFTIDNTIDHELYTYFINISDIDKNKFGTTNPIPYRDNTLGINLDLKCYGEYSIKIINPITFYYIYGSKMKGDCVINDKFNTLFFNHFMQMLPYTLNHFSKNNISCNIIPNYKKDLINIMQSYLYPIWGNKGINVVDISILGLNLTDDSLANYKALQQNNNLDVNQN